MVVRRVKGVNALERSCQVGPWVPVSGALLIILTLAACQPSTSGSPNPTPTSTTAHGGSAKSACDLFTADQVRVATGIPMDGGQLVPGPVDAQGCQYFDPGGGAASFAVFVYRGTSAQDAQKSYTYMAAGSGWTPFTGVGDQASANLPEGAVAIRRGSLAIDIQVSGATAQPTMTELQQLARQALAQA